MNARTLVLTLVLAVIAMPALAGNVYRWVDKDGKVHFGDRPPPGAQHVQLRRSGASVPAPAGGEDAQEPGEEAAAARAAACEREREKLRNYRGADRIVQTDALGQESELDEEQRQQLLELTERRMREHCDDDEG
jgi:hypothetical protein